MKVKKFIKEHWKPILIGTGLVVIGAAVAVMWAMSQGEGDIDLSDLESGPTPNELKGRSWIENPGRKKMIIVFHDAFKAGPHVDVHIVNGSQGSRNNSKRNSDSGSWNNSKRNSDSGSWNNSKRNSDSASRNQSKKDSDSGLSMIYRVKPDLYEKLRYNNNGLLTEDSKKKIIDHIKTEIANGSRVPQNLDHTLTDARQSWAGGSEETQRDAQGNLLYGAGKTRQVILEADVDVFKAGKDSPIEMFAPALNPHRSMYIYKLYGGKPESQNPTPILIWGNKKPQPPVVEDRLHLKMIQPKDSKKLAQINTETSTAKYDGASCYVSIGSKGTTVWSPRISKRTGDRIEYTFKLDGIGNITSDEPIVGMGELLFLREDGSGSWIPWNRKQSSYLSAAEIGGILNSQSVLPEDLTPEIRLYRIDKVGRKNTRSLDFWENRALQERTASLDPTGKLKVVELMTLEEARKKGFEGIISVPEHGTVDDGFKVKFHQDPDDWIIDSINFYPGASAKFDKDGNQISGGQAGVVWCTSLESGKKFKLGPGQMGNRQLTDDMEANPGDYEGRVIKVVSRHGHEGRAAKVLGFHLDKGTAI